MGLSAAACFRYANLRSNSLELIKFHRSFIPLLEYADPAVEIGTRSMRRVFKWPPRLKRPCARVLPRDSAALCRAAIKHRPPEITSSYCFIPLRNPFESCRGCYRFMCAFCNLRGAGKNEKFFVLRRLYSNILILINLLVRIEIKELLCLLCILIY